MDFRKMGVLDSYFASPVVTSRLSDKSMSFPIFGDNQLIGTANEEDVWNVGGRLTYMTAPGLLDLVSTDAADNPAGAGLTEVRISGLDENYDLQTETLQLNGTTIVQTLSLWIRIYAMAGSKPGAADPNTAASGTITLSDGGNIQAQILTDETASSMSMFTIPAGYTGFFDQVFISGGPNDDFIARFKVRREGNIFVTRGGGFEITNSNAMNMVFNPRLGSAKEKSDTKFAAIGVTNNAQVRTNHSITIVENDYLLSLANSI